MSKFDDRNWYGNDNDFQFHKTFYERDAYNGRCYLLTESRSLRWDADLVRKRISNGLYREMLDSLKQEMAEREARLKSIQGGAA